MIATATTRTGTTIAAITTAITTATAITTGTATATDRRGCATIAPTATTAAAR